MVTNPVLFQRRPLRTTVTSVLIPGIPSIPAMTGAGTTGKLGLRHRWLLVELSEPDFLI